MAIRIKRLGGGGGASSNSFSTIQTTSGTSPVAASATDTLSFVAGAGITVTGNSALDTVTIAATEAGNAAHLADAVDAHAGSAITNTPSGNLAATTVQAALNELQGDIDAHVGDTTDAHVGTAIGNTPSGNLAATTVQAALNELQSDIDTRTNVTLAAVGSSPAAEGASLSGQALTLQPASTSHPGVILSGAQTIGGAKTIVGATDATHLKITGNGTQTNDIFIVENSAATLLLGVDHTNSRVRVRGLEFTITSCPIRVNASGAPLVFTNATPSELTRMQSNGTWQSWGWYTYDNIGIKDTRIGHTSGAHFLWNESNAGARLYHWGTTAHTAGLLLIQNNLAANRVLVLKGIASQSGNYLDITNSSDTSLISVDSGGELKISTAGKAVSIKDGSNCRMGTATLVGGTVTVSNTVVTANSRIFLSAQDASGTHGNLGISAKTAATSFVITSTDGADTRSVAWLIVEPL